MIIHRDVAFVAPFNITSGTTGLLTVSQSHPSPSGNTYPWSSVDYFRFLNLCQYLGKPYIQNNRQAI